MRVGLTPIRGVVSALATGMPTQRVESGPDGSYSISLPSIGTLIFGLKSTNGDLRPALLVVGFVFIPAAIVAWFMPDHEAVE